MPLHIKASAQAGSLGAPVFDPVATNEYIKTELSNLDGKRESRFRRCINLWEQMLTLALLVRL